MAARDRIHLKIIASLGRFFHLKRERSVKARLSLDLPSAFAFFRRLFPVPYGSQAAFNLNRAESNGVPFILDSFKPLR